MRSEDTATSIMPVLCTMARAQSMHGIHFHVNRAVFRRRARARCVVNCIALRVLNPKIFSGPNQALGDVVAYAAREGIVPGRTNLVIWSDDHAADLCVRIFAAKGDHLANFEIILIPAGNSSHRFSNLPEIIVAFPARFRQPNKFPPSSHACTAVLYHDHCFDGAASAAYFTRFIAGAVHPGARFEYTGMAHTAAQAFDPALFDGDENAIVDLKYCNNPGLTWWFVHHQSAFLSAEDAEDFRRDTSGRKLYDPSYKSCASFIHDYARDRYGFAPPDLQDLVKWSIIIDGAQYPNARTAVELGAPAMKLTLVIEAAKGSDIVQKIICWMQTRQLSEIVAEPEIQALYAPLYHRHLDSIDLIERLAVADDGVVFFDLAAHDIEGYNKFIPYDLFPDSTYTVSVNCREFADQDLSRVESMDPVRAQAYPGIHL